MIRNIATTYGARFASLLATILLLPLVTSHVGAEQYGYYALAASLGLLFQQDLGLGAATTKFVAGAWNQRDTTSLRRILASSSLLYAAVALVAGGIAAFTIWGALSPLQGAALQPETVTQLAALGSFTVLCSIVMGAQRQVLAGLGLLDLANGVTGLQAVARVAATVLVLTTGGGIVSVALVDAACVAGATLVLYVLRTVRCKESRFTVRHVSWASMRPLLGLSFDLLWLSLASAVILQFGTVIAGLLLTPLAVTMYAAAQRALSIVKELTNSLTSAVLPAATVLHDKGDGEGLKRVYLQGTRWANMLMIALVVPLVVNAQPIMTAWVGEELAGATLPAQVLLLSLLLNNNHLLAVPLLTARGRIRPFVMLHILWALTGSALAFLLAPPLGVAGIAIGFSAPLLILEPFYVSITLRTLQASWREFFASCLTRPVLIPALAGAVWMLLSTSFPPDLVQRLIAALVWILIITAWLWFGSLHSGERHAVRTVIRRVLRLRERGRHRA